jgi:signal peptidase I
MSDTDGPAPEHAPESTRQQRGGGGANSFLRELPVLLLIAFVLAFLLRTFVLQVFYIPSSSMEPTLQINDRMVVEKVTYRFREPRHGEIAVFEGDNMGGPPPGESGVQRVVRGVGQFIGVVPASARDFVKRVVGLPGDEIVIESGQLFVNGQSLDEPYVVFDDESDFGPVTVPEDRLFFLGDNRPNSSDSRRSLGFVATDDLVGRAVVIIWPVDHGGLLTGDRHEVPAADAPPPDPEDGDARGYSDDAAASGVLPRTVAVDPAA